MLQSPVFFLKINIYMMKFTELTRSPLFKGLSETEIGECLSSINYRVRSYPAGSMIAQSSDNILFLLVVLKGHVRGEMVDISGHVIKIEDIYPPQALAAAFLYGQGSRYPVNVFANIDSEVLIIDKNDYLTLLHANKILLTNYLEVICSKARFLSDRLRFLSFHTIKAKMAHYLMSLPGALEGNVILDRSQQELAEYFGVARPSLARAMRELESDGLLSTERRKVKINDTARLERLTQV